MVGIPVRVLMHHTPELRRQYNWKGRLLESLAFRAVSHTIFTSEGDRRTGAARDRISPERSTAIYYGLHLGDFRAAPACERAAVRSELGLPSDSRVIINAARLVPQKRHRDLIDAAALVLQQHRNAVFLIAGEGESRADLEQYIDARGLQGLVRLLGHRNDVPRLLAASDLFALSSSFEGACYAVLEAMAAQLPVVSTAVGGIPEAVEDGVTGKLVAPGDPAALATAIGEILSRPDGGAAMGHAGRERILVRFTCEHMVRDVCDLYVRLVEGPSRR
jgi:glycosyltransferase involved in cell wall biosynthesis